MQQGAEVGRSWGTLCDPRHLRLCPDGAGTFGRAIRSSTNGQSFLVE
jgi:hypothetical protein